MLQSALLSFKNARGAKTKMTWDTEISIDAEKVMRNRYVMLSTVLTYILVFAGCEPVTAPAPDTVSEAGADAPNALAKKASGSVKATGGGQYNFTLAGEMFPGKFSFNALQIGDQSAKGKLRYVLDLEDGIPGVIAGGIIEFHGDVTCVSVDQEFGRAWVGGVVTQNRSTQPDYRDDATTQVGKDIWFRVLDDGEGNSAVDRTTFVGFEGGGGIITSEEYCEARIWPSDNARTHPVTGNIQVHH